MADTKEIANTKNLIDADIKSVARLVEPTVPPVPLVPSAKDVVPSATAAKFQLRASGVIDAAKFHRLASGEGLPLPARESSGAAGIDLRAAAAVSLAPGARGLVGIGFAVQLPAGYEGQIRPRSGLALRNGVTILNAPGTIDSDYRGEVGVILINLSAGKVVIDRGTRIAQLVVAPVAMLDVVEVDALDETARGDGGFGSTGE